MKSGIATILAALILFSSQEAMACYCADNAGGGFICEEHCTLREIEDKLGPDHGPVEMVSSGILTADNLSGTPAPQTDGTTEASPCYATDSGDLICPQGAAPSAQQASGSSGANN